MALSGYSADRKNSSMWVDNCKRLSQQVRILLITVDSNRQKFEFERQLTGNSSVLCPFQGQSNHASIVFC